MDPSVMAKAVVDGRTHLCDELLSSPIPRHELIRNLGLYMLPMEMKRQMFFADLYQQIVDVPGIIVEFGTRWGQNLATLQSLRAILEPYHHRRTIVGFDTFEGFPAVTDKDGRADAATAGAYSVTQNYELHLEHILSLREQQSPMSDVRKFRVIKGDAPEKFAEYLAEHPETIVALAYFDMDLYQPTADCLKLLRGRVTQGSIIGFDELNHAVFPGETLAVRELLGLENIRLRRSRFSADESYFIV
ncbi:MAG: TylF/MycF/NovP-related O-methyltransferase [Planctomycetaceae bacterium]